MTPWSVFQDGSLMTITPASLQMREPQSVEGYYTMGYNTPKSHVPKAFVPNGELMLAWTRQSAPARTLDDSPGTSLVTSASLSAISRAI
jgi:hypothetical protein